MICVDAPPPIIARQTARVVAEVGGVRAGGDAEEEVVKEVPAKLRAKV